MANEHFGVIADFFVNKPLYAGVSVDRPTTTPAEFYVQDILPAQVDRECEQCNKDQRWDRTDPPDLDVGGFNQMQPGEFSFVTYLCRNCRKATLRVWFEFRPARKTDGKTTVLLFTKVGHYPPFEINPPANLRKALDGDHLALYRRAKTLRHHNLGIGALAYFRRLVEDLANEMLDLLIEMLKETGGDEDAIERVHRAKEGTVFRDKAKVAAGALPAPLRPGGINPFTVLYEMPSEGLHALDDEACCTIVDRVDKALEFIYVQLKVHAEETKGYVEALRGLSKTRKPTT